jgi:hypothetical protein
MSKHGLGARRSGGEVIVHQAALLHFTWWRYNGLASPKICYVAKWMSEYSFSPSPLP